MENYKAYENTICEQFILDFSKEWLKIKELMKKEKEREKYDAIWEKIKMNI